MLLKSQLVFSCNLFIRPTISESQGQKHPNRNQDMIDEVHKRPKTSILAAFLNNTKHMHQDGHNEGKPAQQT